MDKYERSGDGPKSILSYITITYISIRHTPKILTTIPAPPRRGTYPLIIYLFFLFSQNFDVYKKIMINIKIPFVL